MYPNNIDDLRGQTNFEMQEDTTERIIKVLGVGGGGGNAVSTMFKEEKIRGVSYLLCNTDKQALEHSPVPDRIVLGPNTTGGLGAGNKPERAKAAAEESADEIRHRLTSDGTKMVFITAGMGGGTGTGAAPIIGRIAREAGILTVGIVTIPFKFEGGKKIITALRGVNALKRHVDALLVVNNERLIEVYEELSVTSAFDFADATLSASARGISDMINNYGRVNLDFRDVQTTLENKGVAVISSGVAQGNQRLEKALTAALNSPLLNNNNVSEATHLLLCVYSSAEEEIKISEFNSLTAFTEGINPNFASKFGYYIDNELEPGQVRVTLLASGFDFKTSYDSFVQGEERIKEETIDPEEDELVKEAEEHYGKDIMRGGKSTKRPLLLTLAELDNEDLLCIAEEHTAFNRDLRKVEEIRQRLQQPQLAGRDEEEINSPEETIPTREHEEVHSPQPGNVISFM